MPLTEAQKRANKKWDKNNTRRVSIVLKNSDSINYDTIKNAADNDNKSVNAYIITAITEKISREQEQSQCVND